MLACPSAKYLHLPCPGCGMQRSLLLLLNGQLAASLRMHPAGLPFLALVLFLPLHLRFRFRRGAAVIVGLQVLVASLSFGFYVYRILTHQLTL